MSSKKSDLVIVYHRQPYEEVMENGKLVRRENKSPNGIVPTLKSFFGHVDQGSWIAWKEAEDPARPDFEKVVEITDAYGDYRVSRLALSKEQVRSFYHVTSKEALWPVLHAFRERYNYDPVDWPTFREVNYAFAQAAAQEASDDATIWVHDYNLWLVPEYLRQMKPNARIGFFHHTPFPGPDVFNVLPWRREIVGSLLKCDVVGFHIPRFAQNFAAVCESMFDIEAIERTTLDLDDIRMRPALSELKSPTCVVYNGRRVHTVATPVGIDVNYIEDCVNDAQTADLEKRIEEELAGKRLLLSVGRTDYTKGGVEQLDSFERVLENNRDLHGKVRLMHVSVTANRNMSVYAQIQNDIEAAAGRINGRFGTLEWQPVALITRPIPFTDLIAYYHAADVAWITPLADGMNLVAKEFVATRNDGDGVLVLSEFAGAAVEMGSAVIANPFSYRSMDDAILTALNMPEEERRQRMEILRKAVARRDIKAWGAQLNNEFASLRGYGEPTLTSAA